MGDMVVKAGDPAVARKVYAQAKLSKTYDAWPYKAVLETRIAEAESNVDAFRNPRPGEKGRVVMAGSTFTCMGCHQE